MKQERRRVGRECSQQEEGRPGSVAMLLLSLYHEIHEICSLWTNKEIKSNQWYKQTNN